MSKVFERLNFNLLADLGNKSKQEIITYLDNIPGDYFLRVDGYGEIYIESVREERPYDRERRVKLEKLEAKEAKDKQDKIDTIKNLKDTLEKLEADFNENLINIKNTLARLEAE